MPSRKSGSSEITQSDSRRSSLRRLSSIASFQALFTKRRSNHATDSTVASSSSNLSLASTATNAADLTSPLNASQQSLDDDTLTDLPQPPAVHQATRRSSYICLPDDPIGGMPRSRTFSNLPLPTRAKRTSSIVASQSQSRLPTALLPSTRLPSPQMSSRKHSHSRLMSLEAKPQPLRNRVKRSDTEPLLQVNAQQPVVPRSTAFKENISLSPIKPLPALDMTKCVAKNVSPTSEGLFDDHSSSIFLPRQPESSPVLHSRLNGARLEATRQHKSSPIQSRPPASQQPRAKPVQRFNSQPLLASTNTAGERISHHGEVRQTRLMSARQVPTPPAAKALSQSSLREQGKRPTIPQSQSQSQRFLSQSSPRLAGYRSSPRRNHNLQEVHDAETQAYWSGRLCALLDRFRNEELNQHLSNTSGYTPKAQTDKMHTIEAGEARIFRAFAHLRTFCATQEAKDSLTIFQYAYADMMAMPELGRAAPIVLGGSSGAGEDGPEDAGSSLGMSETRKISFMDRLLGRQKRRSLVLV